MRNIWLSVLVVGLSLAFLYHFSLIWIYGRYSAGEPNLIIRTVETAGLVLALVFGLASWVHAVRCWRQT